MQSKKNVKVKEVIESLCRLLSVLEVDSIPSAETFRRAKFNKGEEAAVQFWTLLYNIILKATPLEYGCSCTTHTDEVSQSRMVRGFLWMSGYGADWVIGPQLQEVGSRQLLLALGWLLSSGDLLDVMLRERIMQLDTVAQATTVSLRIAGPIEWTEADSQSSDPNLLRRLQWQIGRLRFQRRRLMSLQEERARLLDQILSSTIQVPSHPSSDGHTCINSSVLKEACQQVQKLCDVLEAYLDWKHLESLFWSWMESVLDCQRTDQIGEPPPDAQAAIHQTSRGRGGPRHGDPGRGGLELLEGMLLRLQTGLRNTYPGQVQSLPHLTGIGERSRGLSGSSQEEVEKRVSVRLRDLEEDSAPTVFCQGYRPILQPVRPKTAAPGGVGWSSEYQASQLMVQLRQKEARLLERRNLRRQAQRTEIQELVGQVEGVVLIPPTL
ncbi:tubulin epsilon and delta complex protein 1 [Osmerus mordax]|uniref:tubulin epsilon and delta complex protein 1 n=1 Tax=Osmerus mordax TaxID=8014 RepID=UPI00350FFC95